MAKDDGQPPPPPPVDLDYHLGSSDHPGVVITPVKLKGPNYDEWAKAVRRSMIAKFKFGFLDGSILEPTDTLKKKHWVAVNSMLVSWITNTLEDGLRSQIEDFDIASELWMHLKQRYCVVNGTRICQLKQSLGECKQSSSEPVTDYFGRLSKIWKELVQYCRVPQCSCGLCKCNIARQIAEIREEDYLHYFLMGLDDPYEAIRAQLLAQSPLPLVDNAYQTVINTERLRVRDGKPKENVMAFKVESRAREESGDGERPFCTYCNRMGHWKKGCFHIIGFPYGWDENRKGGRGRGRGGYSTRGGRGGYGRGNASSSAPPAARANTVQGSRNYNAGNATSSPTSPTQGLVGISSDQAQQIIDILKPRLEGNTSVLWIVDTGASNHVTNDISHMRNVKTIQNCPVGLPDGQTVNANQLGSVTLDGGLVIDNVLFVPNLNCNLISVTQLSDELQCTIQFTNKICVIQDQSTRTVIGVGERQDGLYFFRGVPQVKVLAVDCVVDLWHQRMGHPSEKVLKLLPPVSNLVRKNKNVCDVCPRAKQTRDSFPISENNASSLFELVHIDLWGPYKVPSSCGAKYFLTIVDDYSRGVWISLIRNKTEVESTLLNFIALIKRQFDRLIKVVRSDNGTEFNHLQDYFVRNGIIFESSCVGTPQQNGRVERKHQHILNVARALRFQGRLPIKFWGECALTACYLINRTPSPIIHNKTPYEMLFGKIPSYVSIRVFGCLCYAHNQRSKGDKFESRSRKCVFLGYPFGKKGWQLFDIETKEYFVSRDVKFHEQVYPFGEIVDDSSGTSAAMNMNKFVVGDDEFDAWHGGELVGVYEADRGELNIGIEVQATPGSPQDTSSERASHAASATAPHQVLPEGMGDAMVRESTGEEELGRGKRVKFPSTKLRDCVTHTIRKNKVSSSSATSSFSGTPYPITYFVNYDRFSERHRNYIAAVTEARIPRSYKEAMQHKGWRDAMASEIKALEDQGTWSLEKLPEGKKALGSKWVYTEKRDEEGKLLRLKARLVVFGNHQEEGIDYGETFAPVAKMSTVRTFLSVAAIKNWDVHQMDVHNAFLHGDLKEEIYMKVPPGVQKGNSDKVCKMKKSLYGLKQAPRCWFEKLSTALKKYGFKQSYSDYSLFTLSKGGLQLSVLIYVDDMIIAGNNTFALESFKAYLSECFKMKDLGALKYFLGLEVARSKHGFYVCQRKYAMDIISETGLLGAKPADFPMEQNHKLALAGGKEFSDGEKYRRLIGRLIYLAVTRPDLAYSVHILSQFMQCPREEHWEAALRVVRYLKKCPGQGILLRSDSSLHLEGWCDSDWASCPLTRRSLTGWFVLLGLSPVSWKTKKQHTVSRSSAEAEYRSMAALTCELKWLKQLLRDLGVAHKQGMNMFCDSQSALHIANNPVFHERTKHIEADCHFIRDAIKEGVITPSYVSTKIQLADIFTKALGKAQFEFFLDKMGIRDLHAPS